MEQRIVLPVSRAEAIQVKSPVYQTEKPCKYGHVSPRDTINGWCLECRKAYNREYKQAARDALRDDKEFPGVDIDAVHEKAGENA